MRDNPFKRKLKPKYKVKLAKGLKYTGSRVAEVRSAYIVHSDNN